VLAENFLEVTRIYIAKGADLVPHLIVQFCEGRNDFTLRPKWVSNVYLLSERT
jgi:hypothetical protein